jgi:hypothetical protein
MEYSQSPQPDAACTQSSPSGFATMREKRLLARRDASTDTAGIAVFSLVPLFEVPASDVGRPTAAWSNRVATDNSPYHLCPASLVQAC